MIYMGLTRAGQRLIVTARNEILRTFGGSENRATTKGGSPTSRKPGVAPAPNPRILGWP